ncbi:MAG: hypothetical protein MUF18_03335 [Fimbriiglobus sp.]|nr:hypothetical protein [Fimbriiglobus sp.]
MSLATDLLDQADQLAKLGPKNPKQANLRRAVSAAYYALFHLLAEAAAQQFAQLCGRTNPEAISLITRSFAHIDMKKASERFEKSELPAALQLPKGQYVAPADLVAVARAFGVLYAARMEADYNTGKRVTRAEAGELIQQARKAFAAWERVKDTPDARTYLVCFSLWETWNKKR